MGDYKVKIWFNEKSHKSLSVSKETTTSQLLDLCSDLLRVDPAIRHYFALHLLVNGKDHEVLRDKSRVLDHLNNYKLNFDASWGESFNNGFVYRANEAYRRQSPKIGESNNNNNNTANIPIISISDTANNTTTTTSTSTSTSQNDRDNNNNNNNNNNNYTSFSEAKLRVSTDSARPVLHIERKGIGHQRSKSSPAVSGDEMKVLTLNKTLARSPTPITLRSDSVQPEEKDEAKNLGVVATAPHLEPRVPSSPSPSPPAPSLKTRSKTITAVPGAARPLSTSAIAPLSSSPSTPRASISPRTSGLWEATPKGGSLGRSHGATLGSRRPAASIFDEKEKEKEREREERERQEAENEGTGKTRGNSPPPPRQRYTPPPTMLSPLVSAALGTPTTPVLAPPAPVLTPPALTPPLPSSPHSNNRQRAQTTGSKLATSAHKWLKVLRGNSQTNLNASSPSSGDGKNSPNLADDDIQELLGNTIDRLKIET